MENGLLEAVKNYLDITYEDPATDEKLGGIIARGMNRIDAVAGTPQDYEAEGLARSLLFDYCRYARSNVLEMFEANFQADLITLRIGVQTDDFAKG